MNKMIIKFLNILEGYKTRCKNLHWSAPDRGTHKYLDEFFEILQDYQDNLAEGYMGIKGQLEPMDIVGEVVEARSAISLLLNLRTETLSFYESIPDVSICKGLSSECETFIQDINKYIYLFNLCLN